MHHHGSGIAQRSASRAWRRPHPEDFSDQPRLGRERRDRRTRGAAGSSLGCPHARGLRSVRGCSRLPPIALQADPHRPTNPAKCSAFWEDDHANACRLVSISKWMTTGSRRGSTNPPSSRSIPRSTPSTVNRSRFPEPRQPFPRSPPSRSHFENRVTQSSMSFDST